MQTKTVIGVIFWLLLAAFIIPGYVFGFQKLVAQPQKAASFKRWGYSIMFMRFLGLGEIVALTTLLFTQLRYIGIVFFCIVLPAAVYIQLRHKEPKKEVMAPIFVAIHLLVLFVLNLFL